METAKIRKIGQRPIFLLNFMEISVKADKF